MSKNHNNMKTKSFLFSSRQQLVRQKDERTA